MGTFSVSVQREPSGYNLMYPTKWCPPNCVVGTRVSDMQKNVTPGRRKGRPNYPPEFKQQLVVASCEPGVSISKLRWKTVSYGRQDVELSSSLLSGWVDACSRLLEPLDESLQRYVLNDGKLHADDTLVLVLLSGNNADGGSPET